LQNNRLNYHSANNFLIIITGPTAIGKTYVAIKMATHFNTEIISADSRQFYKEMSIGTAVPSKVELQNIKHHLIQFLSVSDYYNVSRFEKDSLEILQNLFSNHSCAIAVGGSGMYIDTLCYGIDELPDPDNELRQRIANDYKTHGLDFLKNKLKELDPAYYETADLSNPNRIMRAIEVCLQTGNTYTSLRRNKRKKRGFEIIKIGLNQERAVLFDRINADGLLDEAKNLIKYRNLNALNTVGYKEMFAHFDDTFTLEQAIEKIKTNTRRYAKRQLTWFKRDKEINWFNPDDLNKIVCFVEEKMKK